MATTTQAQAFLDSNTSLGFFFGNSCQIIIDAKNNLTMATTTWAWAWIVIGTGAQDWGFFLKYLLKLFSMLRIAQQWLHKPKLGSF